jgi:aspartate kinase
VTSVSGRGPYSYLTVTLGTDPPRAERELAVLKALAEAKISINLVKLHGRGLSFVVSEGDHDAAHALLTDAGYQLDVDRSVTMVSIYAAAMRSLHGVMSRISGALLKAGVALIQTGDGPDTVFCLVDSANAKGAIEALRAEFQVPPPAPRIVVQKFGGKSVGTPQARALAAERIQEAIDAGLRPVVVVSAIGRRGEPYATDTLLEQLDAVDPNVEPEARERDLLMACGELISTVIMAQTLKARGLKAVALTGGQAGIQTDYKFGDAQIVDIDPSYIEQLLFEANVDVVVVAGFQGVTEYGAITTLGRGGSDTTASALAAAMKAEKVEIYTHVDGVMTADPEVAPDARTLPMVTYEELCNMAHQGAKVVHPRAAEIAMMHQIPLWVKTSFERRTGTLVAPLAEIQPAQKRPVTGVATISKLVYFTLTGLTGDKRLATEHAVYEAVGAKGINFYLNSEGPDTSSFLVDAATATGTHDILREQSVTYDFAEDCELVSVIAVEAWEEPGLLLRIAQTLRDAGIEMLQFADTVGSVSCLVRHSDAGKAVKALHAQFALGNAPCGCCPED